MKVIILGADGFVGKNLLEDLSDHFDSFGSSRQKERIKANEKIIFFDLNKKESWKLLVDSKPDCIINCIVSSAIQNENSVKEIIDVNYLDTIRFYEYLGVHLPGIYLIHLGTAFEYNLNLRELNEQSECLPQTYYGISKYLTSRFLLDCQTIKSFSIIRPFNIFGPYDKMNKIIPYLIFAQKKKKKVPLSEGLQERDYFFVKDLSGLIKRLLTNPSSRFKIINAGCGKPMTLKELAKIISYYIKDFDDSLWQWGKLPYRQGESSSFYNNSSLAVECGMALTVFTEAIETTINYYLNDIILAK